jgi:hypothetical protein
VVGLELVLVHTDDDGRIDFVLGRHGENDLFGSRGQVFFQWSAIAENTGGLDDETYAEIAPRNLGGIGELGHDDPRPVDDHRVPFQTDILVEDSHHRVVFEQVGQLFVFEQVVDRHNLNVLAIAKNAVDRASDATEPVDADSNSHYAASLSRAAKRPIRSTTRLA